MAQQGVEQKGLKKHNWNRTARMGIYGGGKLPFSPSFLSLKSLQPHVISSFYHSLKTHTLTSISAIFGPAATTWYGLLTRHIQLRSTNLTILTRVAADQFIFAPINMGLFLSSMAYFEGASVRQRLADAYIPGYQKNLMLWPWVQFTNFKYVPMEHRVLVVNVVSLGWNCYLSWLNSGGGKSKAD